MSREEDLYYNMDRSRLGLAVILNNLDKEQEPTKKDVEIMGSVLRDIGQNFNGLLKQEELEIEIFSQIIGDTIEQNLRVLQAQRGFVFDSGFQESKKSSPSQVLGCGYGLM